MCIRDSNNRWATVTPAAGWTFLVGDFAGDGKPDVVGYDPSNGTLSVGTNTGSTFAFNNIWATVTPAAGWTFLAGHIPNYFGSKMDVFGYQPSDGTLWQGINYGSAFAFSYLDTVTPAAGWTFLMSEVPIGYDPSSGTLWKLWWWPSL